MRLRARVDRNQAEIVKALRAVGCSVQSLAAVGKGCPDILVGVRGVNILMEIKDGKAKDKRQHQLTPDEERWHREWNGQREVVKSVEEALAVVSRVP